ncbi:MAG: helix-turn-helix transcriptional regulator [Clostridia bacterium]|nr:helix-turn-helix transcriptional regulator [Oscillospiraceae bacterium]MBQ9733774.1 helix-turn-helix transcriptional regulator [Clostridia bacterium]
MINSEAIKKRMKELGITQKDLAERLGVAKPTVSQKINGVRPLYLDEAEAIADAIKLSSSEFVQIFFAKEIA